MKWALLAFIAGALAGIAYGSVRMLPPDIPYGEAIVRGSVAGEIRKTAGGNVRFDIDDPRYESRVRIFAPAGTRVAVGDVVTVRGTVEKPEPFEDFNYPRYLAGQGVYATMWVYEVEHIRDGGFSVPSALALLRERARGVLIRLVHGAPQEIAGAMALGYGSLISDDVGKVLSRSGIRHITAISGLHIMLLTSMLIGIFVRAGATRRTGIGIALGIIVFFIALVGAPSSAVRAGLMGGVLFLGQIGGRPLNRLRLLLYAAVVMLAWNPHLLFSDAGFQLSFSAILGIILVADIVDSRYLARIPWSSVRSVGAMTIAATLFTLPLTLFYFGVGSLGGILMNLAVIPFLAPLLVFIFGAVFVGSLYPSLGILVMGPADMFLSLVYWLAERVAEFPLGAIVIEPGSYAALFLGYIFVAVITWRIKLSSL